MFFLRWIFRIYSGQPKFICDLNAAFAISDAGASFATSSANVAFAASIAETDITCR